MNRKHLRSLAAVQRGKKNIRSMEEKAEIFGDAPLEQMRVGPSVVLGKMPAGPHPRFGLIDPELFKAPIKDASYSKAITEEWKRELLLKGPNPEEDDFDVLGLGELEKYDPSKLVEELLAEQREMLVNSTPEQFFWRLQCDVSKMMDQAMQIGTSLHLAPEGYDLSKAQESRKKLNSQARDIVIFMMRARGMEVPVPGEQVEVVDLSGFPRTGIPSKQDWVVGMDPAAPDSVSKTIQRYVGDVNIEDTYPKTQSVPLEVAAEMAVKNKPFSEE